jgi:predicted Na+-dependent transporter
MSLIAANCCTVNRLELIFYVHLKAAITMTQLILRWNRWLSRRLFLLTIVGLVAGYLFPISNSPSLRMTAVVLFAYMTLVTSMGTSFKYFVSVFKRPQIPFWILFLTHFITPVIAWAAGHIMYPNDPLIRLGYLIGASVPIGVSSIIWTALTKGNVAVSLVAVTLDTLIVPVMLPTFFMLLVGKSFQIDYWGMGLQLMAMVTLPSLVGMIWHDHASSKVVAFSEGLGSCSSKLAMLAVIYINSAVVMSRITWSLAILKTSMVTLFMVVMGFLVGYCGTLVLKDRNKSMVLTMMYNVGLRNVSVGLVLALTYFPPAVSVPITLFILFQQPVASAIPFIFKNKMACQM